MMLRHTLLILCLMAMLLAGCDRNDETGEDHSDPAPGVEFLMFPNPQASLGVGDYEAVISNSNFFVVNYTLTVTPDGGTSQTFTGTVPSAIFFFTVIPGIVTHNFEQAQIAGATLTSTTSAAVTLSVRNSGNGANIFASAGVSPSLTIPRLQIDQAAYTNAYYAVVDSTNAKTTLAGFKTANGFNGTTCQPSDTVSAEEYHVKFRDVMDLGYGRHMCWHRNKTTGDIAVWVENFQVSATSEGYGPLNLEALINDDYRWHVGTNAIEYSATPTSGGVKITKFYTFNPDGTRRTFVDLDHRGAKAMPVPCISCHGGKGLPLTATGLFPTFAAFPRGDTGAHMQPLNVDTLDFSLKSPWTRPEQEAALKRINQIVLCTYPRPAPTAFAEDACRTGTVGVQQWQGTNAEMIKSWYGGDGMPNATQSDTYVPIGWQDGQTGPVSGDTVPVGATNLYRTVVAPYCRVCHAMRGNRSRDIGLPGSDDIDFTEYSKFIGTNNYEGFATGPAAGGNYNRLLYHVFQKGNMPLAFLKWKQFWESDAPATLASFVPGATSGGSALRPNRPIAIPGPNRTIVTGVATKLSAAASVNATSYRWRVTSNAVNATLVDAATIRPTFTANVNGVYTLELIVNDGTSDSSPATQTIGAVASLTDGASLVTVADPANIRFSHIQTILQDVAAAYFCTGCHTNAAGNNGPPVFFNNYDRDGDTDIDSDDLHQFYLHVKARINFTDVESSFIIRRPSGHHHPGGLIPNFNSTITPGSAGRGAYDIFLNWILNGAPE